MTDAEVVAANIRNFSSIKVIASREIPTHATNSAVSAPHHNPFAIKVEMPLQKSIPAFGPSRFEAMQTHPGSPGCKAEVTFADRVPH
jgi:hypothetical protein